uniref:Uncharacterized protein n=1 Tax=viral metagenome TaxID=1070528 RepID=A0A2V0R9P4_9ZZZZ
MAFLPLISRKIDLNEVEEIQKKTNAIYSEIMKITDDIYFINGEWSEPSIGILIKDRDTYITRILKDQSLSKVFKSMVCKIFKSNDYTSIPAIRVDLSYTVGKIDDYRFSIGSKNTIKLLLKNKAYDSNLKIIEKKLINRFENNVKLFAEALFSKTVAARQNAHYSYPRKFVCIDHYYNRFDSIKVNVYSIFRDYNLNQLFAYSDFIEQFNYFKNLNPDNALHVFGWWAHDFFDLRELKKNKDKVYFIIFTGELDYLRLIHRHTKTNDNMLLFTAKNILGLNIPMHDFGHSDKTKLNYLYLCLAPALSGRIESDHFNLNVEANNYCTLIPRVHEIYAEIIKIIMQIFPVNCGREVYYTFYGVCNGCGGVRTELGRHSLHCSTWNECTNRVMSIGVIKLYIGVCSNVPVIIRMQNMMIDMLSFIDINKPFISFDKEMEFDFNNQLSFDVPGICFTLESEHTYNELKGPKRGETYRPTVRIERNRSIWSNSVELISNIP